MLGVRTSVNGPPLVAQPAEVCVDLYRRSISSPDEKDHVGFAVHCWHRWRPRRWMRWVRWRGRQPSAVPHASGHFRVMESFQRWRSAHVARSLCDGPAVRPCDAVRPRSAGATAALGVGSVRHPQACGLDVDAYAALDARGSAACCFLRRRCRPGRWTVAGFGGAGPNGAWTGEADTKQRGEERRNAPHLFGGSEKPRWRERRSAPAPVGSADGCS